MTDSEKINNYIQKNSHWKKELTSLRSIFQKTELIEEVKWGIPAYTINGNLVAGLGAFKNHYAIWFYQGVFLKDNQKQLVNAQEGKTKALRQWNFFVGDPIDSKLVLTYILEAIANTKDGKKVKPQRKKELVIPTLLDKAFKNNKNLANQFDKLSPGKQREYAEHISSAKRDITQVSRLDKCIPLILEGKGLYDKYKNC